MSFKVFKCCAKIEIETQIENLQNPLVEQVVQHQLRSEVDSDAEVEAFRHTLALALVPTETNSISKPSRIKTIYRDTTRKEKNHCQSSRYSYVTCEWKFWPSGRTPRGDPTNGGNSPLRFESRAYIIITENIYFDFH